MSIQYDTSGIDTEVHNTCTIINICTMQCILYTSTHAAVM